MLICADHHFCRASPGHSVGIERDAQDLGQGRVGGIAHVGMLATMLTLQEEGED